ncbi:hypothetical protein [Ectobacillus panaciterrae]|uniref:hypothetical protein n=1 Tax=Ectobacillus panaciterrae TaxID=363872 RepID=UPI0004109AEE|nr:hypothetical protein [Ectobacillus panaciterrae]
MEFAAFLYLAVVVLLLIGTSKKAKLWFGSIYGAMITIFIAGTLTIKYQTGFFDTAKSAWRSGEAPETLGSWVVPFYIIAAIALLVLINFRLIKKALYSEGAVKWVFIILAGLLSLLYVVAAYLGLFIVGFLFFPFAP